MVINNKHTRQEIDLLLEAYGRLERAQETLVRSLSGAGTVSFAEASNFVIAAIADYIVALSNIGLLLQS